MRVRKKSRRYSSDEYATLTNGGEPQNFIEAIKIDENHKWMQIMQEELQSLKENQIYDLGKLPKGIKLKSKENNPNPRYKEKIIVKGCHENKCIDFEEIFSQ